MVVASAGAALSTAALMLYYNVENRRRDLVHAQKEHVENSEFFNLTDRENHEFRVSFLFGCIVHQTDMSSIRCEIATFYICIFVTLNASSPPVRGRPPGLSSRHEL